MLKLYCPPIALLLAATLLLGACTGTRPPPGYAGRTVYLEPLGGSGTSSAARSAGRTPVDNVSFWDGGAAQGSPSIVISLGEQKAKFYKGGVLVGISQISSGREGYNTPTGTYEILQKNADHASNLYGMWKSHADGSVINDDVDVRKQPTPPPGAYYEGSPMPYFMRISNGGVGMHAGYLPGFPASHGCIRMPEWMAQHFFHNVERGTPVRVEY